jgi:hypothetical protein
MPPGHSRGLNRQRYAVFARGRQPLSARRWIKTLELLDFVATPAQFRELGGHCEQLKAR